MKFVNVGALSVETAERPKTKKALKELVAAGDAAFDQTSLIHDGSLPGTIESTDIREGVALQVVGPDPYTKRQWYATVKVSNGRIVVS